ncbi:hypothetical protein PG997_014333 [Apiospora hydei]|uniref:Uncharacterized protein n=1 Tax=Apiospora hydei TaxID=1337664 RepID=A0ABR1UTG9_9PEZI
MVASSIVAPDRNEASNHLLSRAAEESRNGLAPGALIESWPNSPHSIISALRVVRGLMRNNQHVDSVFCKRDDEMILNIGPVGDGEQVVCAFIKKKEPPSPAAQQLPA